MSHSTTTSSLSGRQIALRATAVACAMFLAGCQTMQTVGGSIQQTFASEDPCANNARNTGVLLGGLAGALIGKSMGDSAAAVAIGSIVGSTIGGLIGSDIDARRCELHKIAQKYGVEIKTEDIVLTQGSKERDGLRVSVASDQLLRTGGQLFAPGTAEPTAEGRKVYIEAARSYKEKMGESEQRLQNAQLLLTGHTDDQDGLNSKARADLSEKRARAVAEIFAQQGFKASQIFYEGAGEMYPAADNATEAGRRANRRVEIVDLDGAANLDKYLSQRSTNIAFLSPGVQTPKPSTAPSKPAKAATTAAAAKPAKATTTAAAAKPAKDVTTAATAKTPSPASTAPQTPAPAEKAVASAPAPVKKPAPVIPFIDFGGKPIERHLASNIDIGKPQQSQNASVITVANANSTNIPLGSCINDYKRVSNPVKSLSSGKPRNEEFVAGLNKSKWVGTQNGHYVELSNMTVLKDGYKVYDLPQLAVHAGDKDKTKSPTWMGTAKDVNVYTGQDEKILYRVFFDNAPMQCMDIVIPKGKRDTEVSRIFYLKEAKLHEADHKLIFVGK